MSWVAVAVAGAAVVGAGASYVASDKSAGAIEDAANTNNDTQRMIYNEERKRWEPYEAVGKAALPVMAGWDAAHPLPSFEDTVNAPMETWNYTQSPAYLAKNTLAQRDLNNQLQARGLSSGGLGAVKATDLSRRLTADDYTKEREYKRGSLVDAYKSRYSENSDMYNRILDQVKVGTGASAQMGNAGNQYASSVGKNTMAAGAAEADFYSGLAGMPVQAANLGLKVYDVGNRGGWWDSSTPSSSTPSFPQSNTNALPSQAELAPYDSLY
jgi:hypothetical protein